MNSTATKAFKLDEEKKELRDRYGRNLFGQGCLLARRLVERAVPFVEPAFGVPRDFAVVGSPVGFTARGRVGCLPFLTQPLELTQFLPR